MEPTTGLTLAAAAALSKPIEKLVDTVRDVMEPGLIVIKAHATAKAKVVDAEAERKASSIRATGEAEAADIVARAQMRRQAEEVRQHQNLESIMRKAADALPETVSDQSVDRDWTAHFVDEAKNTSREDMQALWARLLAGEVASPGTFSKRLVTTVKMLEPSDAISFSFLCKFIWKGWGCLTWKDDDESLKFDQLRHLDALGFVSHEGLAGFAKHIPWPESDLGVRVLIEYHRKRVLLESVGERPKDGLFKISWGNVMLTSLGAELAKLVEITPDWNYLERAVQYLQRSNHVTARVLEDWEIVR